MFWIFYVLLIPSWCSSENIKSNSSDNILCRGCGNQIATSDTIISKSSAASIYSFNDTIFERKEVLVQLLSRDHFFEYPVITSTDSSCIEKGDWEDDNLWFPDYAVKPCFCTCGDFVGWVFENDSPTTIQSTDKFFGLILTNIIGENCKYFLNFKLCDCSWGDVVIVCLSLLCWFSA